MTPQPAGAGAGTAPPGQPVPARAGIWRLAAVPLAAGVVLRLVLVGYIQALHGSFLFLDDQGYDKIGWSLAQAWHMHTFPSPASAAYAGTLAYLYYVFVAALYFVAGHHWLLVKVVAALLSALSVPAAAAIGGSLAGRRLAVRAAWLAALYPNAVFWGATGLKDGTLATLVLVMAAIALRPLTMRGLAGAIALLAVAFLARPVMGFTGLAMLAVPAIVAVRGRRPGRARPAGPGPARPGPRLLVLLVGLPALVMASVLLAARYLPTLKAGLAGEPVFSLGGAPVAATASPSPVEVLRALLGPFPWSFGPATDNVYRAMYPGTAMWIVLLPAVALGCWEVLRRGPWAARGVVVSALAYLYLYAAVFQDQGFFRQRYTVEILLLVVGLYAFARRPQWAAVWTAAGVCVVAPGALVQAGVLPPAGLALVALVAGTLWFAADSAVLARGWPATRWRGGLRQARGRSRAGRRDG